MEADKINDTGAVNKNQSKQTHIIIHHQPHVLHSNTANNKREKAKQANTVNSHFQARARNVFREHLESQPEAHWHCSTYFRCDARARKHFRNVKETGAVNKN